MLIQSWLIATSFPVQNHSIPFFCQQFVKKLADRSFISVQSGINSVQISLRLTQTISRVFPWNECPCTSRKQKSDRLWKSLGWYLDKVPPRGNLNALGCSKGKPSGCALGFTFGTSLGFRFSLGWTFSRQPLRLFHNLSQSLDAFNFWALASGVL